MQPTGLRVRRLEVTMAISVAAILGIVLGVAGDRSVAAMSAPTEHKGLQVSSAGAISNESMKVQIGLTGYKLQLRQITIEPGGQIAKHGHQNRPGVVKVISGTWTEGRAGGEVDYTAADENGILEDENTVHWFWNRGDTPATAMVCDIVPDN